MKSFDITIQMKPLSLVELLHGTEYLVCSSNFRDCVLNSAMKSV